MYLEIRDLSFCYGNNLVLKNINAEIERGEITGLIGANGAGKTTVIRNIVKKLTPQNGDIIIDNVPIKKIPLGDLRIAYIPDEPVYYEELSLLEHLQFVQALYPTSKIDFNRIVERMELGEHLHKIPSMLSKGTLQKMMIALALMRNFELFIGDEPFNGLDPTQINEFKEILKECRCQSKAVLISTHLLDMVEDLCDRYIMINDGTIVAQGTKESIINKYGFNKENSIEQVYLKIIKK